MGDKVRKSIRVYETKTGLLHAYHEMLRLPRSETVYIIEGVESSRRSTRSN